ncbi:hypothetical protein DNTS_034145 [Danionella cerebrum]|uniref:PPM-type phosphatase domain-containing protein n=1 Tax=Danionella cerebrum TaxID=2873325 RepID=A0A553R6V9_9TELE|nr:hypothetical protein DNTS_034145 [Danionella translucida]
MVVQATAKNKDTMRTSRKGTVEMPAFVRQLVKETEKRVTSFFKGGRGGGAGDASEGEEGGEEEGVLPSPYLDRPVLDKHMQEGCASWGLTYALASMQGWRAHMEDFHNCFPQLGGELSHWAFFAVFDGHAGSKIRADEDVEMVTDGFKEGFFRMDKHLHAIACREGWERGGTTVVSTAITPHHIYFVNCGDSRAVLCRAGRVAFSTEDHKPFSPGERERIESAGGSVTLQRVNGSLAVSRALGDFGYKTVEWRSITEQMVSPEPEVTVVDRSPADEFLILACDGVWDTVSNEELCAFVHNRLRVCTDLREGSLDNISIILVCFPNAPQLSPEALHQEAELEDFLESKVAEIYEELSLRGDEPDLLSVLTVLASTEELYNFSLLSAERGQAIKINPGIPSNGCQVEKMII